MHGKSWLNEGRSRLQFFTDIVKNLLGTCVHEREMSLIKPPTYEHACTNHSRTAVHECRFPPSDCGLGAPLVRKCPCILQLPV